MLERTRLESKKISKTQSVTSQIEQGIESDNVHIGPSDHVPWLDDRKWAYIRLEGRNFGDVPLNIELKLEVWDSPNSAGVIIDAVRCAKVALDRGIGGPLARPVGVLHEVAAGAVPRRRGPRDGRGVRPRRRDGHAHWRDDHGVNDAARRPDRPASSGSLGDRRGQAGARPRVRHRRAPRSRSPSRARSSSRSTRSDAQLAPARERGRARPR